MRISLLIFLFLHTAPLFSTELAQPPYRRAYTKEQLEKLTAIKSEWEIHRPNMLIQRWYLMKDGIHEGLHPDDIYYGFVIDIVKGSARDDPHEATLHNVEFLLQHNADPDAEGVGSPLIWQGTAINHAPTYAIAQCLINHKANVFPVGIDKELNQTLLHNLMYRGNLPAQSVKQLIAIFCNAGIKPDEYTSTRETPLTLLARKNVDYDSDHYRVVADTLVKVGTPIDYTFEQVCIMTKSRKPAAASIIDAIHNSAYNAKKEVAVVKEKLRETRYPALVTILQDKRLYKDLARIIADYDLNPHDYFIQKMLADTDTQLQNERQEREAIEMRVERECIIQ